MCCGKAAVGLCPWGCVSSLISLVCVTYLFRGGKGDRKKGAKGRFKILSDASVPCFAAFRGRVLPKSEGGAVALSIAQQVGGCELHMDEPVARRSLNHLSSPCCRSYGSWGGRGIGEEEEVAQ
jgi:hypothetical protein